MAIGFFITFSNLTQQWEGVDGGSIPTEIHAKDCIKKPGGKCYHHERKFPRVCIFVGGRPKLEKKVVVWMFVVSYILT